MILDTLHYVYGLDTSCFNTPEEMAVERKMMQARNLHTQIRERIKSGKYKEPHAKTLKFLTERAGYYKDTLKQMYEDHKALVRTVRPEVLTIRRQISIFDSVLTRCFGLKERQLNEEIVVIQVYFYGIAESLIRNGFYMNGNKYIFFSASAGQIRTKKFVAVREDLLNENWNRLTAGLTIAKINELGGFNVNKFLSYLSLCNSATREWKDFDIDRAIVVDDFENKVTCQVDYIDEKDYSITRQTMDVPITHTDGCGMMLPEISKRNFMARLPFVKGLLVSFDFRKFIKDNNCIPIIKDVYGQEHNIIEENIQIIFCKSQFKLWKLWPSWKQYQEDFKSNNCQAGICNDEEIFIPHSKINYQMLQTLYDMSDDELKTIAADTVNQINALCTDVTSMLRAFGAAELAKCKNGFQRSLNIYPELLSDSYSRETLKDIKNNLENELYSGRLKLDCKYSFVVPDLYAACEYWFLHINDPKGLLQNGEVSCRLYKSGIELDCLRSPHLYIEHAIQNNVVNRTTKEWFTTDAVYASCHSPISKILQFDGQHCRTLWKHSELKLG